MPDPRISIQPDCLHVGQPVPPQIWHCTSISAGGSVKGKNDGRNRTRVSAEKKRRAEGAGGGLKSKKLDPPPPARAPFCSNNGEGVAPDRARPDARAETGRGGEEGGIRGGAAD